MNNDYNPVKRRAEQAMWPVVLVWVILKAIYKGILYLYRLIRK